MERPKPIWSDAPLPWTNSARQHWLRVRRHRCETSEKLVEMTVSGVFQSLRTPPTAKYRRAGQRNFTGTMLERHVKA